MKLESQPIRLDNGETVSSVWAVPAAGRPARTGAVVLAHGAGADMQHRFIKFFHEGVARAGWLAVRFNFPYKEKGRKAPDPAPRLESAFRAVIAEVRGRAAPARLAVGGKSMGGRIASHLAAAGDRVDGLFLLGYPLHPPNRTDRLRVERLGRIGCPALFIQGSRDTLCRLDLLRPALQSMPSRTDLKIIEGGDHSFKPPKRSGLTEREAWEIALKALTDWLQTI